MVIDDGVPWALHSMKMRNAILWGKLPLTLLGSGVPGGFISFTAGLDWLPMLSSCLEHEAATARFMHLLGKLIATSSQTMFGATCNWHLIALAFMGYARALPEVHMFAPKRATTDKFGLRVTFTMCSDTKCVFIRRVMFFHPFLWAPLDSIYFPCFTIENRGCYIWV